MNSLTLTSPTISKKEVQLLAVQLTEAIDNPIDAYVRLQKIKVLAESAMQSLKPQALEKIGDDPVKVLNGELTWQGGGKAFSGKDSFGHNPKWTEAVAKVKQIEGLMKLAEKQQGSPIYDDEGIEVPAAKAQTRKPFLKYKW